jgi:hypothetical protein
MRVKEPYLTCGEDRGWDPAPGDRSAQGAGQPWGGVSRSLFWCGDCARLLKHVPCSVTPTIVFVPAVDTKSGHTIECARTRGSSIRSSPTGSLCVDQSDQLGQPVRLVIQRTPQKPNTSSSRGIPLELVDLGLLWGRQATRNAIERRRDERRTADGVGNLGFGDKK